MSKGAAQAAGAARQRGLGRGLNCYKNFLRNT